MPTKNNKDHLSNEVSINAKLTETGISAKTRSRAITSFDRLLGSAFDVPTAYFENCASRIRSRGQEAMQPHIRILDSISEGQDSEMEAKLINLITEKQIIQPYINKLHVMEKTLEELGSNAETNENHDSYQEVGHDWLNYFGGHAEKASTESTRARWAKVLAGEIRQPGTFSIRALRFLAEVDRDTAVVFAETVRLRFNNGEYILQPNVPYGEYLLNRLRLLEQQGLVDQISPNSGIRWTLPEIASNGFSVVAEGGLCLRIHTSGKVEFRVIPLTHLGKEIASLLDPVDPIAVLKNLAKAVPQDIQAVDICDFVEDQQGNVTIPCPPIMKLRP